LVDDDPTFCEAMRRALTRRGFRVALAHDVDAALASTRIETPAYAIVDLKMSGKSGLTLIPRLRALSAHMRIVVLTGYASVATAVEAIKLGATHYLAKPVDADAVVAAFGRESGDGTCGSAVIGGPPRVGAHSARARREQWQRLCHRAQLENAPPHAAKKAGKASGPLSESAPQDAKSLCARRRTRYCVAAPDARNECAFVLAPARLPVRAVQAEGLSTGCDKVPRSFA
jgi:ActR/RegA family two-component response regulator